MKDEVLKVKKYRVERFNDGMLESFEVEAHSCTVSGWGTRLAANFFEVRDGEHVWAQAIVDVVRIREVPVEPSL